MRLSLAQCAQLTLTSDVAWEQDVGSGGASCVAMMQPADHREGDDLPPIGGLALAELRGVLIEREVGPGAVIVLEVLSQDATQVLLSDNDDVVEAVPPNGTDYALAVRILLELEALAMPADHGLGLHEDQGVLPVWPQTAERDPECAVRFRQLGAFALAVQNGQLLSQREVFESELALRLQARSGGREQGVQEVTHQGRRA